MATGVNYGYCAEEFLSKYDKYRYATQQNNGNTQNITMSSANGNATHASGISDAGFSANTCTDGEDNGRIGLDGVLLNLGEGILKGAWNGVVGAVTDSNGKLSLKKTLTSVALVGACVVCPALGAVACGIGAIAGGSQLIKGAKVAFNATTDAEAKAAWENIGEGASTVVGCATGAKASIGAVKASSSALMTADDIAKATDDISKALGNADDIANVLKNNGFNNVDEIMDSIDDISKMNADDIINLAKSKGGASKMAQVQADDSLQGVEKYTKLAKGFVDDAISSTKNNTGKVWNKAKKTYTTTKEVAQYKNAQRKYNKIDMNTALTDDEMKIIKEFEVRDTMKSDDAAKVIDKIDEIVDSRKAIKNAKAEVKNADDIMRDVQRQSKKEVKVAEKLKVEAQKTAKTEIETAQNLLKEAQKTGNTDDIALAKQMLEEVKKASQDELKIADEFIDSIKANSENEIALAKELKTEANTTLSEAKSQTPFGKLTSKSKTYEYIKTTLKPDEQASVLKNIKNIKVSDVAKNLSADGQEIFTFLQQTDNSYAQAVQQFGYDNVMEVLKVAYAYGQTNQIV